jgi:hypothetical protein
MRALGMFDRKLAVLFVVMAAGCAPVLRGYDGAGVRLFVANEGIAAVTVVVERDGDARLLGRVERYEHLSFELDSIYSGTRVPLLVRIDSEHDGSFLTDTIRAERGRAIDIRLDWPLRQSRWWYY